MKKLMTGRFLLPILFVSCFSFLLSCKKDKTTTSSGKTITDVVVADNDLSLLKAAVVKANLSTTLSGTGPFTLFAPTNEGFAAVGIDANAINSLSATDLTSILLYHVLPAQIKAANVPAGPNAKVITESGDSVFVTSNANGVFVNGAQVVQADIAATNGVVHKINYVLKPATGNIVATASADTSLTYLVAAVLRASTGSTNVAAALSGNTILTVFAPTNDAFRAAGFATIDAINAADPNALTRILVYHVVAGRVFSSDLSNGAQPTTLGGATVTVGVSNSAVTVKGNTNTSASNVIAANIVARNGVVHKIDQVLLP